MLCNEFTRQSILSRLQGYRYAHTLGCERAAIRLAKKYGGDVEKASFAAILHDITKRLSEQEQLNLCKRYGIIPDEVEKQEWKMLHGKTAAAIAKTEYNAPQDVVEAIACHTTGRANMEILDKILYMADYIEETRNFDGVEQARALAARDLDVALLYCFDQSVQELIERSKLIHTDTIAARNDLVAHGMRSEMYRMDGGAL